MKQTIKNTFYCLILILVFANSVLSQRMDWWDNLMKLKPSVSSRGDAELLFAKKSLKRNSVDDPYELKEGILYVDVSNEVCQKGDSKISAGIITSINFFLKKNKSPDFKQFVKKQQINLQFFTKEVKSKPHGRGQIAYYRLEKNGLQFLVDEDKYLYAVLIDIPEEIENKLSKCDN